MKVLVDSSVWIDYFRGGTNSGLLDYLLEEDLVVTNDLILAELVPFLRIRNQRRVISLLISVLRMPIVISWKEIIENQFKCLKKGINGIGIPDLIIAQNATQSGCVVYSLDRDFTILKKIIGLEIIE